MSLPPAQQPVAALLARLTGDATPVETHISLVFVGREEAFKLKKAVRYDFLDFSTLAARERFTRRELELNQPGAPSLYRDVLPVTRAPDGTLALDGAGEVVEWVLRMAPLPAADFLPAIAARGALTPEMLDEMADAVAALHAAAPEAPRNFDSPGRMAQVLAGNLRSCHDAGIEVARAEALAETLTRLLDSVAPAMRARAASGCVRRCHGDLHLGNIVLVAGHPTPFDALEFDEALAITDTGYDIAFLVMDLDQRCGRGPANRVLNRYLGRCGDTSLLGPLPFWLALRAMVRAHIEARAGRDGLHYLAAAEAYARPVPPRLVAIGGLQGTGKTWLARDFAPLLGVAPGALHLRTDEARKRRFGVAPEARLPEAAYAPEVSDVLHAEMFAQARAALDIGHSVVLDAVFLDPAMRVAAAAAAGPHPFLGLWLEAPRAVLNARVAARSAEGLDASDADVAVLARAAAVDPGPIAWQRIDAAGDARFAVRAALALTPGCSA